MLSYQQAKQSLSNEKRKIKQYEALWKRCKGMGRWKNYNVLNGKEKVVEINNHFQSCSSDTK